MSIGIQLRHAREEQSLSLDQVAQATHIRLHYLEALEADKFELLPSSAQLRGFLRAYGDYLKLNSIELLRALDKDSTKEAILSSPAGPVAETGEAATNSDMIFKEIGHKLQSQRELMGVSLNEVERHTHIRMHYVKALETGDVSHLPSPVQGKGMLSNYASFLGLDTESILLRFADGLQASLYNRQVARNEASPGTRPSQAGKTPARPSQLKRLFSMDLFVGGFLIIFLLGFAIWGALRIQKLHSGQGPSPTAPPVSEILLSTPAEGLYGTATIFPATAISTVARVIAESELVTGTVQAGQTEPVVTFQATQGLETAPVQVYVVAQQSAWMRVTVDGEIAFEGRVIPGSAYSFAGTEQIELLTGNGAGLQVLFNQQDLGLLGSFGEVVERVFSIEGIQTGTPAIPPTRTPAPTGTITPTPTPTRTSIPATPTPTPKP